MKTAPEIEKSFNEWLPLDLQKNQPLEIVMALKAAYASGFVSGQEAKLDEDSPKVDWVVETREGGRFFYYDYRTRDEVKAKFEEEWPNYEAYSIYVN